MILKLLCITLGAALVAVAAPALAADTADLRVKPVSTSGVDFHNRDAVRALYARLQGAAEAVCDTSRERGRVSAEDRACVEKALAKAVQSVDRPMLTALYRDERHAPQQFASDGE